MRRTASWRAVLIGVVGLACLAAGGYAAVRQTLAMKQARAAREMADSASNLLATLSEEQTGKARFEFKNEERLNWHFIPRVRKGLSMKEMTPVQLRLAQGLLASGLSQRGYVAATTIMTLEEVLKEIEKGSGPNRDPEQYFVSIFGQPGGAEPWGWRVEGHHLSLNFTIVGGKVVAGGPAFFGTNPAEVRAGPRKGLRVLGSEEDMGRQLVKSLSAEQLKKALVDVKAPADILTSNMRKAMLKDPTGLAAAEMSAEQREMLMTLVDLHARRLRAELADGDMEKIEKAGEEKILFAWAGALEAGQGHYYRVHGPTFLVEYDNTQNNANHVHTVWRDLADDFGEDMLKKHYEEHEHGEKK